LASTAVLCLQSVPCDSRVGRTEPAKYRVYSNYHYSAHNEHNIYFHFPDVKTGLVRSVISMDQQSIVTYLSLKGLNAVEIHNELVATFKGEAKPCHSITYCLRKPSFSNPWASRRSENPAPILNVSDEVICWLYLKSLSRRRGSLCAEPTYTLPRSTTASSTSLGSLFDIFVGSHIFRRKRQAHPSTTFI
jgi:hypothetical protein